MKGKALRRALATKDAIRISGDIPLIVDSTELITPQRAEELLANNKNNRPVNWNSVEKYADIMSQGKWGFHAQGIVLDEKEKLLTGQNRLWAVVYSGKNIPMRISRGTPERFATLLDRGRPQTARDLATRKTEKKHSPTESSIARGICALNGKLRPSLDELAETIVKYSKIFNDVLEETKGTKKTKSILMILATICLLAKDSEKAREFAHKTIPLSEELNASLSPMSADKCWGKGAAFGLAMEYSRKLVNSQIN